MNFLTELERDQLKLQYKRERDKRICDRIKAILLYDEGWTPQQIAKVLLISDQAVRNHDDDYQASSKLKPEEAAPKINFPNNNPRSSKPICKSIPIFRKIVEMDKGEVFLRTCI